MKRQLKRQYHYSQEVLGIESYIMLNMFCAAAQLILCCILFLPSIAYVDAKEACSDPIAAIIATIQCVEQSNATCASAGYDSTNFTKLHNGIDTNIIIDSGGAFGGGHSPRRRLS